METNLSKNNTLSFRQKKKKSSAPNSQFISKQLNKLEDKATSYPQDLAFYKNDEDPFIGMVMW